MMKKIMIIPGLLLLSFLLFSENLSLSGVDASSLLRRQRVDLYLTLTDDYGAALPQTERSDISIYESPDGENYREILDKTVVGDANLKDGIQFFMLMDNSGSMYYDMQGRATENEQATRMTQAGIAMQSFIDSIGVSRDQIALASFNTGFQLLAESSSNRGQIQQALGQIQRPQEDQAYTELYAALNRAAPLMESQRGGRKVMVVLSDGENYPFFQQKGEAHPEYGEKIFTVDEAIESLQLRGITLFAINYGTGGDPQLSRIARETGGSTFDARSSSELANVYDSIRQALLQELKISYVAGVYQSDRVWVKVVVPGDESLVRFYFNSGLFGSGEHLPLLIVLLIFLLALICWILLILIPLERHRKLPNLEMVGVGLHQRVLDLTKDRTVIGGSSDHDVTIVGGQVKDDQQAATIIYDEKTKNYTLIAQETTMVNNQEVTRKELKTGDVIKVGDSLIIFDDEATQLK
jgi:Ca-activated chloride channel family protein